MSFERARNEENKKIRLDQIKTAAIALFDELSYSEITLSKIGDKINFTRGNLYKYISSKEDIYLYVMIDEIEQIITEMEAILIKDEKYEPRNLAHRWATILDAHPRYLKLFSLLFTILEQNASLDVLIEFKNYLAIANNRLFIIMKHNIPEFTALDIEKLMDMAFSYIIARYPLCNPTQVQLEATKLSNYNYTFPNFVDSFTEVLLYLINGIKLSRMYTP